MTSPYQQIVPPPALGSPPRSISPGVSASSPPATQTPELVTKAVQSQDQLEKSLAEPTPAGLLGYFADTLTTQLARNPFKNTLEVQYPREHVDALSKWMKTGGRSWTHQGRFCRQLQEVEDVGAFVGMVKEWRIDELAPHAERELEAAKKCAAPPANTKESSANGKQQARLQKQACLQKRALLQKQAFL